MRLHLGHWTALGLARLIDCSDSNLGFVLCAASACEKKKRWLLCLNACSTSRVSYMYSFGIGYSEVVFSYGNLQLLLQVHPWVVFRFSNPWVLIHVYFVIHYGRLYTVLPASLSGLVCLVHCMVSCLSSHHCTCAYPYLLIWIRSCTYLFSLSQNLLGFVFDCMLFVCLSVCLYVCLSVVACLFVGMFTFRVTLMSVCLSVYM